MNSQTSIIQTKAKPNKTTADSVENISANAYEVGLDTNIAKNVLNFFLEILIKFLNYIPKTYKMTFRQISRHFVSGSFEKVAGAVHASRE